MIFFGVLLIQKINWITYVFGAFLLFTAIKMLFKKDEEDFKIQRKYLIDRLESLTFNFLRIFEEHENFKIIYEENF